MQSGSSVRSDPALNVSRVCGASEMEDVIQSFKAVALDVPQVGHIVKSLQIIKEEHLTSEIQEDNKYKL